MSALAIALILASAGIHATWNRLLHATGDRVATMTMAGLLGGLVLLPAILAQPSWEVWPFVVLSASIQGLYAVVLSAAYQRGSLAVAYPIGRGTAPLLVTIAGLVLLEQPLVWTAVLGALALAVGLSLIGLAAWRRHETAAIAFALLTGLCIAGYSVVDSQAVQRSSPVSYLGLVLLLQSIGLMLGGRLSVGRLVRVWRQGTLVAAGSTGGYLLVLFAFQLTSAGRATTLRETSVLLAIALAGRRQLPIVWLGGVLVVIGAILALA